MNNNFWNDAARAGAVLAVANIFFTVLAYYATPGFLLPILSLVLYWAIVIYFTRRRVASFGDAGYSYGRCVGFVSAMCLCAGFLEGAFAAVAANWLFAEQYAANLSQMVGMLESTGAYSGEMLQMVVTMSTSPIVLVLGGMLGGAVEGGFVGLIVAAFTRREPNIFRNDDEQ